MANEATRTVRGLLASLARPVAGALFPEEFEVYMMTLELVDFNGDVADFFTFPIMPSEVTKTESEMTSVKTTAGGIVSLTTDALVPHEITINGDFGRNFKVLIGRELINFKAFGESYKALKGGKFRQFKNPFSARIKTGYGCTKLLQHLVNKSVKLDGNNKPYKMFLHNPALGESYLVEKQSLTLRQDTNTQNMMWRYTLNFKILGDANLFADEGGASSLKKILGLGLVQAGANSLAQQSAVFTKLGATNPSSTIINTATSPFR
jgi:hypothetical protein